MTTTLALGPEWLQPDNIIDWLGPWALVGLALIIFAECGLLLGFFLPGDSLLFTAGLFVAQAASGQPGIDSPLWLVCVILVVSAFAGNVCGYYIGRLAGPAIFDRPKSRLFKPEHVAKTQAFFDKYGNRAIVLARFVPVVRTFITVMAGVGRMEAKRFLTYSLLGGVLWAAGVTLLGYWLGQFEFVRDNIEAMLIAIVLLSVLPIVFEVVKARRESKRGHAGQRRRNPRVRLRPSAPSPRPVRRGPRRGATGPRRRRVPFRATTRTRRSRSRGTSPAAPPADVHRERPHEGGGNPYPGAP